MLDDELIDDYIKGLLPAPEQERVERTLASDPVLRVRMEDMRLIHEMMKLASPDVPSQRMWNGIRMQLGESATIPLWERFKDLLAGPQLRLVVSGAAIVLFLAFGIQFLRSPLVIPHPSEIALPVQKKAPFKMAHVRTKPRQGGVVIAALPQTQQANSELGRHQATEVERALSDQDVDDVIASLIRERQNEPLNTPASPSPLGIASLPSDGSINGIGQGTRPVAYVTAALAPSAPAGTPQPLPDARNRVDTNGFWDFRPAALALNHQDWASASSELQAAESSAPEAAERSFARSALQLLGQAGEPVAAVNPDDTGSMSVESASQWQVFVDNHVARYVGNVVARMPGLRSQGPALSLDMAFDRASFGAGTHFVRVQDDQSTHVKDAQGNPVTASEFDAPQGADYLLRMHELRIK